MHWLMEYLQGITISFLYTSGNVRWERRRGSKQNIQVFVSDLGLPVLSIITAARHTLFHQQYQVVEDRRQKETKYT